MCRNDERLTERQQKGFMDPEDRLDEDFMFYLSVSARNWKNLKTEKEKDLAQEWLYKLTAAQETKAEKRDRNVYLSQLALAIGDGDLSGPFRRRPPHGILPPASNIFGPPQPRIQVPEEYRKVDKSGDLTNTYTSKDGRTYVATKSLGNDHGAYTYIGISLANNGPFWVGGDTPAGPCHGFERHFEKPQALYSRSRQRRQSTIFAMEREGGDGDSLDDTRIFTDYVTDAKDEQMSETHDQDFEPSVEGQRKSLRLSGMHDESFRSSLGELDKSFHPSMLKTRGEHFRPSLEGRRRSRRLSSIRDEDFRPSIGVLDTTFSLPAEKVAAIPIRSPRKSLKGADLLRKELAEEDDEDEEEDDDEDEEEEEEEEDAVTASQLTKGATTEESDMDVSEFYTKMITNLDKSLTGEDDLNEYNKEKLDEIKHSYESEMQLVEAAEKTREALLKKLKRVREEESRVSASIKELEIMRLHSSADDTDDSVIETWKEACKLHDEKNLQLLEEFYIQRVRERVAEIMTNLKLHAVHERSNHMKAEAAAIRDECMLQSQKIQQKMKVAEDYIDRIQAVLDEMLSLKTAGPREDPYFDQRRNLAEELQEEVEQLTNMFNDEYNTNQNLEQEILNCADENVFSHPEFTHLNMDNERLRSAIKEKKAQLENE